MIDKHRNRHTQRQTMNTHTSTETLRDATYVHTEGDEGGEGIMGE